MPTIIDALKESKASDLEEVRGRISELTKELDSLRAVERILEVRLNGKKARKAPTRKSSADSGDGMAKLSEAIYEIVAGSGPGSSEALVTKLRARGIETSAQAVGVSCARSGWFTKLENGRWAIKIAGAREP